MPKVLVADEISQEGLDILKEKLAVTYQPDITAADLLVTIDQYDALLVRSRTKVTGEVITAGKNLKVIGRAGVGVDNIDVDTATKKGILVINSPEGNTASAAEHTLALMLSLARLVPQADASMKAGKWERGKYTGSELFNKNLGVIGLGKVGSRVAQACLAMGMKVLVYDPMISKEKAESLNFAIASLDEIWQNADFITIHAPKTRETSNLLNKDVFAKMKKGVRIINAARGGIIDEAALGEAIANGHVAGAALDVFENEPPSNLSLLELKEKVVLTPHLGASTFEAQFNVAVDLAEQLRDYLTKGLARSPVNLPFMRQEILKSLGKYFWLAESMGAIAGELADGNVQEVEIIISGKLSQKDSTPLTVAALRGIFSGRVEGVTYVNAQLVAANHGIKVRETKYEENERNRDEISVIVSTDKEKSAVSGTVSSHDEPLITRINEYPINLTPAKHMLFTSHKDQPGMVAKVAGLLGSNDVNISTMSVARRDARAEAVMVMTLDDPLKADLVSQLEAENGISMARFVTLAQMV
jgi:D-3-phosphoglycerate dehydrogenase